MNTVCRTTLFPVIRIWILCLSDHFGAVWVLCLPDHFVFSVFQGRGPQGTVWVLAVLMSLGSAGLVSVIIWKPVFVFDFDFVSDMQEIL